MTLVATVEAYLIKALPPKAVKALQQVKAKLPVHLPQAAPIAVMYLNDGETRSYVGINNFYSFLLSSETTDAIAELQFFSPNGERILRHKTTLQHFGATTIDVAALFSRNRVESPYGIVALQLTPHHPRRFAYRELGETFSHFFIFYQGAGSVAQVHPLSHIGSHNKVSDRFESSQVITTHGLVSVEALQYNPGTRSVRVEYCLVDTETREIVARAASTVPGLGAVRVPFAMRDLVRVPLRVRLTMDHLPSGNSKPMLRRSYAGGIHTMSHS